jgi:retron-type reverse transcriptase
MSSANSLIDQIVEEHVQAGTMFTAYDVTLEARKRGGNVRHNEARDRVHELFQRGLMGAAYQRTTIDVGAPTKPFLYHHYTTDPNQYKSPGQGQTTSPSPQQPGIIGRVIGALFGKSQPAKPQASRPLPQFPMPSQGGTQKPITPRPAKTLGLDAAQFLPISRDELLGAAKKTNLWGSPWFGRRDKIPPVDDSRTLLIDRALVTNGLLSPEQLAEIHRVGAEMDRLRPDQLVIGHQAGQAGAAAVEAQREERAKLKAKKKAEAAQRKQQREDAIAHRRANDIVFLGRAVSGRLADRSSDEERLTRLGLPILSTPAQLASALKISVPQLRWLAFHTEVATRIHYVHFTVPKRSGGVRTLSAPHRRLATAQNWILETILERLPVESAAHGFVPKRSILTNASNHVGRQVVVNMDLEGFFPSITFPRIRSVFHRCGYSPAVATILALLCTECPRKQVQYAGQPYFVATGPRGLPQGACTSPALSNLVARRLDKRLQGLAAKLNLTYTRYADDLTFSGDGELKERVGYVMARVRHIAQDEGFVVNEKKSRVLRRNAAQEVTGLVVNDRPGVRRKEVRRLRAILHRAKREGLAAQNREGRESFPSWLQGMIAYVAMSQPEVGQKLKRDFESVMNTNS